MAFQRETLISEPDARGYCTITSRQSIGTHWLTLRFVWAKSDLLSPKYQESLKAQNDSMDHLLGLPIMTAMRECPWAVAEIKPVQPSEAWEP